VYGWWVAAPNRAADTPFVITHATGVDTVYRDQTTNHGQWNLLGSYAFNAETAYSVTVSNAATTGSYVVADAIRITSESSLETVSLHDEPFKAGSVNPFNPQLTMSYRLGDLSQVGLKIFNVAGQLTRELVSQEIQQRGEHHLIWDGKDNLGQHAPAGVYFARLEAGKESQTIKLVSLK
jgi:hypothetical protein